MLQLSRWGYKSLDDLKNRVAGVMAYSISLIYYYFAIINPLNYIGQQFETFLWTSSTLILTTWRRGRISLLGLAAFNKKIFESFVCPMKFRLLLRIIGTSEYKLIIIQDRWTGLGEYVDQLHDWGMSTILIFDPAVQADYEVFQRAKDRVSTIFACKSPSPSISFFFLLNYVTPIEW